MNQSSLSEIGVDNESEYKILRSGEIHTTIGIQRVNLFIGANNSGKSRFLRRLFSITEAQTLSKSNHLKDLTANKKIPREFTAAIEEGISFSSFNFSARDFANLESNTPCTITDFNQSAKKLADIVSQGLRLDVQWGDRKNIYAARIFQSIPRLPDILNQLKLKAPSKIYIPILRGLRPLEYAKDVNKTRTAADYFSKSEYDAIETGFNLYQKLAELLLGKPEGRRMVAKYEHLLGQHFFQGAEITLIPEHGKDVVAMKVGNDEQFPIYHLGDGLQQLIIMTSSAFFAEAGAMIFVEEPETNLHPGYLRKLIKFFLEETDHQYFLTTHSNAILDMAETHEQITIHRFAKEADGFKIHDFTSDREILRDLGISPASVYLSNSTIWVEGITDRLYLKSYLKRYIADQVQAPPATDLIENLHYSFVEYQGSTLGHWMFSEEADESHLSAARVCADALVICDGDIKSKGNRAETLKAQLGSRLIVLPAKEIENLLPENILKKTVGALIEKKEKKGSLPPALNKSKIDQIQYSEYSENQQGIGAYLDKLFDISESHFFSESSGTIKAKLEFCRTAVTEMENSSSWELPAPIKALCQRMIEHILAANHFH